jgi:hypothetical protein
MLCTVSTYSRTVCGRCPQHFRSHEIKPTSQSGRHTGTAIFIKLGCKQALNRCTTWRRRGRLTAAGKRSGAEFLAWSAVHGLPVPVLDGPLRGLEAEQKKAISQRCWIWSKMVCNASATRQQCAYVSCHPLPALTDA